MKKIITFLMALGFVLLSSVGWGQISPINETFSNLGPYGGYQTETWTGDDGGTWTATDARTDQTINGKAICIRNGILTSPTVSGGIGSLTVTTQRKFAGGTGNMEVRVNGSPVGTIPYDGTVQSTTISNINVTGDVVIIIDATNSSSDRPAIDDLIWTAFAGGPTPPSITNITQDPATDITSASSVAVSADVAAGDAAIANVELHWNTTNDFGEFTNINMSFDAGDTYETDTDIPAQTNGTTVYYRVYAEDVNEESTTSAVQSYTVIDPIPTITVNSLSLSGFTYVEGSGPSAEQSFIISGEHLTANISIAETANYEISLETGEDFSATNPITIAQADGSVAETTIYVRLKAGLPIGTYDDEEITATSTDADDKTVTCSGSVSDPNVNVEDFANSNATASYSDGSFVGNNGITWNYVQSRDGNGDANNSGISLPALMLRRVSDNSAVYSNTISGGIASFSMKLYKGFTGAGNRQVELLINDVSQGISTAFDDFDEHIFEVNSINITGDIIIRINNITSSQVIVDDITWTPYSTGGNLPPSITNIVQDPASGITSSTTVSVSADVTDSDGTVEGVELHWGTTSGSLGTTIPMSNTGGDTFTTDSDIPAQSDGTTVYYEVYALDDDSEETTSAEQSYTVTNPATTTLPYEETFGADLGDVYTYSVSGATKEWVWNSGEYAEMNGHNSGDTEEDWMIFPGINLDNYSNEILTFETQYKYGSDNADNYLKLMYSTDYSGLGDPTGSAWTELSYTQPGSEDSWTGSGDVDLSAISGTSVRIAFKYRGTSGNYRRWRVDNINIQEVAVLDPASFAANAASSSQIDLAFATNGDGDNVVIVHNADGDFSDPAGAPPAVGQAFAGGTLLYNGTTSPQNHTGLTAEQTVYYKAFSYDETNYSPGLTANATTLAAEPTNHPTGFSASAISSSEITVAWTDADPAADGYLIKGSAVSYAAIAAPVNGTPEADGGLVKNIAAGVQSHQFSGLNDETTYYFKIFPYNGLETTVNYKTDGAPQDDATTPEGLAFTVINFDDAGKWTASSAGITSYATDHTYVDGLFSATGGPALRNTTSVTDGFPGAFGTYSWRLQNVASVEWTITIASGGVGIFEVDVRRWDGSPSPDFDLDYSVNGGNDWVNITTINNASLDESSAWKTFDGTINNPADDIKIRFKANGSTERIMIDNFKWTSFEGEAATNWLADATSSDWNDPANWSSGLPGTASDVVINSSTNDPVLANSFTIKSLVINADAGLSVAPGGNLTVTGTLTNNAGNGGLIVKSDATGTGSLIHNTAGVPATIQRYINGGGYHNVSVPIDGGATAAAFLHSYLRKFDAAAQAWVNITEPTDALEEDEGYMIWYTGANTTYEFTGDLITGAFSASTLSGASGAGEDEEVYNLVPNPYPSAIDWDAGTGWTKTNLQGALYIWNREAGGGANGQYASFVTGSGGTHGATQYIPVGQSFFVEATTDGAPVLAMDNDVRVHNDQAFLKDNEVVPDLLRMQVQTTEGKDESIIHLRQNATAAFDGQFDARKLYGSLALPQLYSLSSDNQMLSINALAVNDETTIVPLAVEWSQSGEIALSFSNLEGFENSTTIFLEDLLTEEMMDIREHPAYSFNYTEGDEPVRFRIHFKGVTSVDDLAAANHHIWSHDDRIYITMPESFGNMVRIELFDLLGNRVMDMRRSLDNPTIIRSTAKGVVIVRVTEANRVYTQKLFIR